MDNTFNDVYRRELERMREIEREREREREASNAIISKEICTNTNAYVGFQDGALVVGVNIKLK
eukprot:scaffold1690_cov177-Ochromonas_danica.AAC.17